MNRDDYLRAVDLFEELRELSEEERAEKLSGVASAVRHQVLTLLEADRELESGPFLNEGAMVDAARLLTGDGVDLPGAEAVIGNYRLGSRLQAGGMGVIYEAWDLRLERRVAVKVLPAHWAAATPDSPQRFRQEARAISQLNHPNVVSVYDAGFELGHYYLAMELVEGRNLRQVLAQDPSSLDDATILDILSQVSAALAVAHTAGIIHRDIKPENIMLRNDGLVKVLDFGLAKLSKSANQDSTSAVEFRSRPGTVAGTLQYLSPEQLLGRPVTGRSDIFSLGVVAYELATGSRPFAGPTDGAIVEAIVNQAPLPPSSFRKGIDPTLEHIILRAIAKEPDLRFQTAQDLQSACKHARRTSSSSPVAQVVRPKAGTRRKWAAAALLLVALGGLSAFQASRPASPLVQLPVSFEQVTSTGDPEFPVLVGDDRQIVYQSRQEGNLDIYLQRVRGRTLINLTKDSRADDYQPAVSPDESRIVFRSERDGGGLFLMELTGENPRRISEEGYFPSWSPDGTQIVYSSSSFLMPNARTSKAGRIATLRLSDSSRQELAIGDGVQPSWSPHGHRIAYWALRDGGRRDIFTVAADGSGKPVAVTNDNALDWHPVWSPAGDRLYFLSDRGGTMGLWRIEIDERSGRTRGEPEAVTLLAPYIGGFSLSRSGNALAFVGGSHRNQLSSVELDVSSGSVGPDVPIPGGQSVGNFSFSPDGQQIAFDTFGEPAEELWIMDINGSRPRRILSDGYRNRAPAWSPDGRSIVFFSDRTGSYEVWKVNADGGEMEALSLNTGLSLQKSIWLDAKTLLVSTGNGNPALLEPARHPVGKSGLKEPAFPDGPIFTYVFSSTKDGRVLGLRDMTTRDPSIILWDSGTNKMHRVVGGMNPSWIAGHGAVPEGRFFVFSRFSECYLFDLHTGRERELFSAPPHMILRMEVQPDGRRIFFSRRVRESSLWLAHLNPQGLELTNSGSNERQPATTVSREKRSGGAG